MPLCLCAFVTLLLCSFLFLIRPCGTSHYFSSFCIQELIPGLFSFLLFPVFIFSVCRFTSHVFVTLLLRSPVPDSSSVVFFPLCLCHFVTLLLCYSVSPVPDSSSVVHCLSSLLLYNPKIFLWGLRPQTPGVPKFTPHGSGPVK